MICDLERRQVIDLLPEREPATVEALLRHHPHIEKSLGNGRLAALAPVLEGGEDQPRVRPLPRKAEAPDRDGVFHLGHGGILHLGRGSQHLVWCGSSWRQAASARP
uniref:hypothetical protein n=1 Tax=Paracoccus mutanolyticus TaxID=1499308 RepID=UPI0037C5C3BB